MWTPFRRKATYNGVLHKACVELDLGSTRAGTAAREKEGEAIGTLQHASMPVCEMEGLAVGVYQVCIFYACLHVHVHLCTCASELPWLSVYARDVAAW